MQSDFREPASSLVVWYCLCSCGRVSLDLIATTLGACLPGILLYTIVQAWIRRKPRTARGYLVAVAVSLLMAAPRLLHETERHAAIRSQTEALAALERACTNGGEPAGECHRVASCVLSTMEARYPTDEAWLKFARRVQANETGIK